MATAKRRSRRSNVADSPNLTKIDPDGDLRLHVGADVTDAPQDFLVCSRALARASPVFTAMLAGNFSETRPANGDWVVSLPEEQPQAFHTVLNIVHLRFEAVFPEESPTRDELYDILVITNKYDMIQILRPWAQKLIDSCLKWEIVLQFQQDVPTTMEVHWKNLLFIALELGQEDPFRHLVHYATRHALADSDNNLYMSTVRKDHAEADDADHMMLEVPDHVATVGLLEEIRHFRTYYIRSLYSWVSDFIQQQANRPSSCSLNVCGPSSARLAKQCRNSVLGSFCAATIRIRGSLFPAPDSATAAENNPSASEITKQIVEITKKVMEETDSEHKNAVCLLHCCALLARTETIKSGTSLPFQPSIARQAEYMEKQRVALGLSPMAVTPRGQKRKA